MVGVILAYIMWWSNDVFALCFLLCSKNLIGHFPTSQVVVSPSLLAQIDATNRKPKHWLLLGLGEPFEPNPWDISDSEDDEKDFLMVPKMAEKELTQSKP